MNDLKIFELHWTKQGEKEWVCARTNIEALMCYLNVCSMTFMDLDAEDEIVEVPREKWSEMKIRNSDYDKTDPEDCEEQTFEEYMKERVHPDIIAGTMYE